MSRRKHASHIWLQCACCQQYLPARADFFGPRALNGTAKRRLCLQCAGNRWAASRVPDLPVDPDAEHTCRRCNQPWPQTQEFFTTRRGYPGQLHHICRACEADARRSNVGPVTYHRPHATDAVAPLLTGALFFKGSQP